MPHDTTLSPDPSRLPPAQPTPFPLPPRDPKNALPALFKTAKRPLRISAPMVRYSKHPFRLLLLHHCGLDASYTPMILAKEFLRSPIGRMADFTSSALDAPLIAQFGTKSPQDFARAAEMVAPFVDGVSLNCGCPQSWAIAEGVGCALMKSPELVASMVRAVKRRCPGLAVGVKIRVHADVEETVGWVRTVEAAGVDYITVHGRLRSQKGGGAVDYAKIARVKRECKVPVVANGGIESLEDEARVLALTGCDGTMTAQALLSNPTLYLGLPSTPYALIRQFLDYCFQSPIPLPLVIHHLSEMCTQGGRLGKRGRAELGGCGNWVEVVDWVEGWGEGWGEVWGENVRDLTLLEEDVGRLELERGKTEDRTEDGREQIVLAKDAPSTDASEERAEMG